MKFHVVITDNETGEILLDDDCCAVIGAAGQEESAAKISLYECGRKQLIGAARTAHDAATKALDAALFDD